MKKILSFVLAMAVLAGTGCIKDKGFDDHKYGINDPDDSPKGVGFPLAANASNNVALNLAATEQTIDVVINLESGTAADQDVHVHLISNPALVSAYNTGLTPAGNVQNVSTSLFNFPADVTIPKGQRFVTLNVKFPNTTTLDPNVIYGIGFTIDKVDGGYTVAQNLKNLLFIIAVKNKYDGIYSVVSGTVTRYTSPGVPAGDALSGSLAGNPDVKLITSGPNSNLIPAPLSPNPGTLYWAYGNGSQVAGIDGVKVTTDPTTNLVTVTSAGNATLANWPGKVNKYDPATKTFYLAFRWNPSANVREYEVVLKYKGPR